MTIKISEVMTTEVETISADQTAREAAAFMLRADAGSIPVCEGDKVSGMITDRDIAVRGVAEGRGPDTPVSELMSDGIICAREDDDVQEVARRMSEEQVRRLPIVDCCFTGQRDFTRRRITKEPTGVPIPIEVLLMIEGYRFQKANDSTRGPGDRD